jgi:ribosomal protein S27AE
MKLPARVKIEFHCPACDHVMGGTEWPVTFGDGGFRWRSVPGNDMARVNTTCPQCGEQWGIVLAAEGMIVVDGRVHSGHGKFGKSTTTD